ncbi:MAG: hypothetical protein Q9184_007501 [Pyrenodesmia sp. 2 TL-2023]
MGSESSYHPSTTSYGTSSASGIPSTSRMSTDPSQGSFAPSTASYETFSAPGIGPSSRMTVDPSQASSATVRGNPMKVAVRTQKAPPPTSLESQAIICQGMVICSGQIGVSPVTKQMIEGGVGDHTAQALNNLSAILEEARSSLRHVVRCRVYLSDMTNLAAMNRVYDTFFEDPKPARTCMAVSELPLKTDVMIECDAHLLKANQSSKAAAKRKGDSYDSGYGGSNGRSPTPKPQRTVLSPVRHTHPSQTKHQAELPGLKTDLHTTRRSPQTLMPRKQPLIRPVHLEETDKGGLLSPVDRQLQAETMATIPRLDSESARQSGTDTTALDDETTETLRYFALPENRNDEEAIQQLFFQAFQEHNPTDTIYKHRYQALKQAAWNWATSTFHVSNPTPSQPLNLMEMATKHPELMEYINATTTAPTQGTTWEELLNTKRAEIVYCILGKVLDIHVFGEELFGATAHQKKMLRMADLELFDANGFPRQQTRSQLITSFLPPSSPLPAAFLPALHTLHLRLTTLLKPLLPLPHPILSPHHRSQRPYPNCPPSTSHLFPLLLLATTFHLSLRLLPHTIYHFPSSPSATSSPFSAEEMSIRTPPNDDDDDHHHHHHNTVRKGRTSRRIVTTSGWPGCVAYRAIDHPSYPPGSEAKRGISTHVLAKADVFVRVEEQAVGGVEGERERGRCLREEMCVRYEEEERKHTEVKKRAGVAAAVGVGLTGLGAWLNGRGWLSGRISER